MKKIATALTLSAIVFTLSGCFEETKSYAWWLDHPKETYVKRAECKKSGSDTDNCRNVERAYIAIRDQNAAPVSYEKAFREMETKAHLK